jgi:sigma-B regulation protein RsbU (phosphoserine phosphatase)
MASGYMLPSSIRPPNNGVHFGDLAVACLKMVTGAAPGNMIEITGERVVFGRHPSCEIVLDNAAVSRHHAQIVETHGSYFIEDLRSRNRTLLNGIPIDGRTQLRDTDSIKVCDVVFDFFLSKRTADNSSIVPPRQAKKDGKDQKSSDSDISSGSIFDEPKLEDTGGTSILSRRDTAATSSLWIFDEPKIEDTGGSSILSRRDAAATSSLWIGHNPEAKLKAVLEISMALGSLLDEEDVLQATLDGLFKVFPQAEEGFVLLRDDARNKLVARATKARNKQDDTSVRISVTVVRQAMRTCEGLLSADASDDARFDSSESISSLQIRSMMCAPLVGKKGQSFGVIQLATNGLKGQFSHEDLDMLVSVTSQVTLAVENAKLHSELVKQRDVERDLEFATQVQLGFLPNQRPAPPGYAFHDYYEAAQSVGGDYFDYITLPDSRVAIALGDVAGKGVPAALLMARLYSAARFHLLTEPSLAKAFEGLNDEIASSALGHRFITYIVAVLDAPNNEVTVANAGHLPPLVKSANGDVRSIGQNDSGMPLGIATGQEFHETKFSLAVGDTMLLYTDGVTEAMNSDNELYGSDGLAKYLSTAPEDVESVINGVVVDVEQFSVGRTQRDDICMVVLKRNE